MSYLDDLKHELETAEARFYAAKRVYQDEMLASLRKQFEDAGGIVGETKVRIKKGSCRARDKPYIVKYIGQGPFSSDFGYHMADVKTDGTMSNRSTRIYATEIEIRPEDNQ